VAARDLSLPAGGRVPGRELRPAPAAGPADGGARQPVRGGRPAPEPVLLARERHPLPPGVAAALPGGAGLALEQNYRSTQVILALANALSAALHHGRRKLWTANPPGIPVIVRAVDDPQAEAAFVVAEVRRLLAESAVGSPADCTVLYRTNAQAREFELACLEAGLPYSVRANNDFLARREIRDLMAYLRLIHNPSDVAALGRIVNTPPRRLAVLERRIRDGEELTLARLEEEFPCELKGARSQQALRDFLDTMDVLMAMASDRPPGLLVEAVLETTGYRAWLRSQEDGEKRLENVDAFHALAQRSDAETLADFLDEISLATDIDTGSSADGLALSTIHAAKGLEWPVVFVAGLEEGLLPHARALDGLEGEGGPLEEELRLLYVAVTRAVDRLYLTYARRRTSQGRPLTPPRRAFSTMSPATWWSTAPPEDKAMYDVLSIRRSNPIEEVVTRLGVDLRSVGRRLVGSCPFHRDDRPSLVVYPADQSYFCFGCGAGGDVIDFVARLRGVGFKEAAAMLAGPGAQQPHGPSKVVRLRTPARPAAFSPTEAEVIDAAVRFYHDALWRSADALAYLMARGLSPATARRCRLGFGRPGLVEHLRRRGLSTAAARRVGLLSAEQDTVLGRIVIPDIRGARSTWLTGRSVDGRAPRYLNLRVATPLLGLELVRSDQVVVTEGPFAWLTAVQWGLPADEAGRRAALQLAAELDSRAAIVELPRGVHDLNDLGRRPDGRAAFLSCLDRAGPRSHSPARSE